jgi:hypothetical protein
MAATAPADAFILNSLPRNALHPFCSKSPPFGKNN